MPEKVDTSINEWFCGGRGKPVLCLPIVLASKAFNFPFYLVNM